MAQSSFTIQDLPTITRNTLESAVEDIKAQYVNDDSRLIPQVVYLKELPSYDEFFTKFLNRNQLCVLTEAATRQWRSRQEWVCEDGSPNMEFLQHAFGNATVPVANCKSKEYSAHAKQEMTMSEFLTYWHQYREAGHPPQDDNLYLKDWHFNRDFPEYDAYSACNFFRSDWMNEFWDVRKDIDDDYRFVYMGPKHTWTSFHADVFRSFSWSANICGRKRWIFFPPGEEEHLKDTHNTLVYDVTAKELEDGLKFPQAHKVQHRIEIIQHPGETIFVPSGWHHQVENLPCEYVCLKEDTISINHNWLNGCNVRQCWAHLKTSLADVEQEISDCRDMEGWDQQCQMILRALTGLDYHEFFRFMESVARRRIRRLFLWKQKTENSTSLCSALSRSHCDTSNHPHASESSELKNEEGRDTGRATGDLTELGEGVLDLSEGEDLNGGDVRPRHWSYCNVNHALFDLASVGLVLKDMRQHVSAASVPQREKPPTDRRTGHSPVETHVPQSEQGNRLCCQHTDQKCSETCEDPGKLLCAIEFLLQKIGQCLSTFELGGSLES